VGAWEVVMSRGDGLRAGRTRGGQTAGPQVSCPVGRAAGFGSAAG